MALIINGKSMTGREYSESLKKKPAGQVAGKTTSTYKNPLTLVELSKGINSGDITNQGQVDTTLQNRGYEGNTEQNRVTVNRSAYKTGMAPANAPRKTPSLGNKSPNSAGSYYGSAGQNTMGTSFDVAGNSILGTLGGKNIIGGQGSRVDRTAGVPQDPMSLYLQQMQGNSIDQQRKALAKERQSQIDAIELSAKQAVSAEQDAGAQDLARQRSMNLRSGLGGSDFGASNKAEIRTRTNDNVKGIEAQKDLAIGNAIDRIEQLAQSRFQIQQNAMQQGFSNMMQVQEYTQAQEQQMRDQTLESLKLFGQSGMDVQTIKNRDPDLYEKLMTASGMSDIEMEAVLNGAKSAAERVDYQYKVMGNKLIAYGVDPMTGQLKTLEQEVEMPDNYEITTMPNGTVLGVPKEWDGDMSKIKSIGNYAKPAAGGTGGLGTEIGGAPISEAAQNILQQINLTGGTVEDYVKGTSNAAQNLRNEVYRGLAMQGGGTDKSNEILQSALDVANKMIETNDYKQFGYSSKLGGQFTTKYGDMMMRANQLNAILARDNLGILKGVLSDTDVALIKAMSGGVDTSGTISEEFAKERIEDIQKKVSERIAKVTPQQQSSVMPQQGGDDIDAFLNSF
jgi:hypothetical protein